MEKMLLLLLTLQGAMKIESKYSDALSIFNYASSFEELEKKINK